MSKVTDKVLGYIATTAEEAFWEALGLASCGCAYEPELPEEIKAIQSEHSSRIETLFKKLIK